MFWETLEWIIGCRFEKLFYTIVLVILLEFAGVFVVWKKIQYIFWSCDSMSHQSTIHDFNSPWTKRIVFFEAGKYEYFQIFTYEPFGSSYLYYLVDSVHKMDF